MDRDVKLLVASRHSIRGLKITHVLKLIDKRKANAGVVASNLISTVYMHMLQDHTWAIRHHAEVPCTIMLSVQPRE